MTNREMYEFIMNTLSDNAEVGEFCEKQIASIDRKNEKARERAAEKRAESDELIEVILGVLGDEPMTVSAIVEAIGNEEVTNPKISARLSALAKVEENPVVEKVTVTVKNEGEKARNLVAYKLCK